MSIFCATLAPRTIDRRAAQLADEPSTERRYPSFYDVEDGTAYLLYMLVRQAKPALAVEVGVADGRSTRIILSAMDANDVGRLVIYL